MHVILAAENPPSLPWERWARHLSNCAVCYRAENEAGCCTVGQRLIFEAADPRPPAELRVSPDVDWRQVPERALYVAALERLQASARHQLTYLDPDTCTCPAHRLAAELREFIRRYVP